MLDENCTSIHFGSMCAVQSRYTELVELELCAGRCPVGHGFDVHDSVGKACGQDIKGTAVHHADSFIQVQAASSGCDGDKSRAGSR